MADVMHVSVIVDGDGLVCQGPKVTCILVLLSRLINQGELVSVTLGLVVCQ